MSSDLATMSSPVPVRFGRRSTRGLLLGLSTARCISAGAAVVALVIGLVVAGGIGLVASGFLWVPLLAASFVTWQGVSLSEWVPVVAFWKARTVVRQHEYRARVVRATSGRHDGPSRRRRHAALLRGPSELCLHGARPAPANPLGRPSPLPTRPTCCSRPATSRAG